MIKEKDYNQGLIKGHLYNIEHIVRTELARFERDHTEDTKVFKIQRTGCEPELIFTEEWSKLKTHRVEYWTLKSKPSHTLWVRHKKTLAEAIVVRWERDRLMLGGSHIPISYEQLGKEYLTLDGEVLFCAIEETPIFEKGNSMSKSYWIYSIERGSWWLQSMVGYTIDIHKAGIFEKKDMEELLASANMAGLEEIAFEVQDHAIKTPDSNNKENDIHTTKESN